MRRIGNQLTVTAVCIPRYPPYLGARGTFSECTSGTAAFRICPGNSGYLGMGARSAHAVWDARGSCGRARACSGRVRMTGCALVRSARRRSRGRLRSHGACTTFPRYTSGTRPATSAQGAAGARYDSCSLELRRAAHRTSRTCSGRRGTRAALETTGIRRHPPPPWRPEVPLTAGSLKNGSPEVKF